MATDTIVINNKKQFLPLLGIVKPSFIGMLMSGLTVLYSMQLTAGDWELSPHVSVTGTYTDNADLSISDKKSEFYTQVTPGIAIVREGAGRVQLEADYSLDYTENRPGDRGRTIAHSLDSNMRAELYKDVFFIDASAGANLNSLTSGGQRGESSVGDVRDPIQTYTYSLSPYLQHHFGRYVNALARYTHDQVINSGSGGSDSYSNQVSLVIGSGAYFSRIPWGLNYLQSKTNNEDGASDSETASVNGNVSYILNRKWRINLAGGYVDYDIQSRRSSTDSFTWDAGATWTPNLRTNLDFSYGEQVFGQSFAFDFNHRWRRAVWRAGYNQTLTNSRIQQMAQRNTVYGTSEDYGDSYLVQGRYEHNRTGVIRDPDSGEIVYSRYEGIADFPTLTDEHYVMGTFNTGFTIETRRSNFSVDAHFTTREYEVQRITGREIGVDVNWDRRLTSTTNGLIGVSWLKNRVDEGATEDTRWRITLGLSRRLTPHTNANLDYSYRSLGSSEGSVGEYRENQVSLTLASQWD